MSFIENFLNQRSGGLIDALTSKLGVTGDQAGGLLNGVLNQVTGLFTGGGLDASTLLGGDAVGSIMSKLNLSGLAETAGVTPEQAEAGAREVVPEVVRDLRDKADDPADLLGLLGGGDAGGMLGSVGKLAGGFFKK